MTIEDFIKAKVDKFEAPYWVFKDALDTVIGKFSIIAARLDEDDSPSDTEMLRLANEAAEFVRLHIDEICGIILAAHKMVAEQDDGSLDFYKIPTSLTQSSVGEFLYARYINVAKHFNDPQRDYNTSISVTPLWDEEHGLSLEYENGSIKSVNDYAYRIEDGKLFLE